MKFVLLCNDRFMNPDVESVLRSVPDNSEIVRLNGDFLAEGGTLPECDAFIAERKTWQRFYSLFRYLGIIDEIERLPLISLVDSRKTAALKGKLGKSTTRLQIPTSRESFSALIDDVMNGGDKVELMRTSISF